MGFYSTHIVPRFIDKALGTPAMQEGSDAVAAGLSGTVLEIGFGSGLNVASYPPEIELVAARLLYTPDLAEHVTAWSTGAPVLCRYHNTSQYW